MARRSSHAETEIKLRVDQLASLKRRLVHLGFSVSKRRVLEINIVFDTPSGALRRELKLLRLRQTGSLGTITFKGPPAASRYKSREEVESGVTDRAAMRLFLERLRYTPPYRYDNYPTDYAQPPHPLP